MSTNHDSTPSALPTLAEVEAFMRHWHSRISTVAKNSGSVDFTMEITGTPENPKMRFGAWVAATKTAVITIHETPYKALDELKSRYLATELKARAEALRKQADELERGAA